MLRPPSVSPLPQHKTCLLRFDIGSWYSKTVEFIFVYISALFKIVNINCIGCELMNTLVNGLYDNDLVSIILPTYNRAKLLDESLTNLLEQTYDNIEIIIVNDSPQDNDTREILLKYANNPKITCLTNQVNSGLPYSLNRGLSIAKGKYLTWTSDDNLIDPEFCSIFVQKFRTSSDIDFLYSDYTIFHNKIGTDNVIIKLDYQTKLDFFINFRGMAGFMWRRNVSETVGDYDLSLRGLEDWDYLLRIILSDFKFAKVSDRPLYYYRVHESSLTSQLAGTKFYHKLHFKMFEKIMANFKTFFESFDRDQLLSLTKNASRKDVKKFMRSYFSSKSPMPK